MVLFSCCISTVFLNAGSCLYFLVGLIFHTYNQNNSKPYIHLINFQGHEKYRLVSIDSLDDLIWTCCVMQLAHIVPCLMVHLVLTGLC